VLLGTYLPDFADDEVELRLRFPPGDRNVGQLANLRVLTQRGLVPISNFVTLQPAPLTGLVTRVDGQRVHTIEADVATGPARGRARRGAAPGDRLGRSSAPTSR
jgi:multidrug efflux pump